MNKNLFSLEFVHLEDLLFHETCDFKRTVKLAEEIKKDGHLKNPVLVASINMEESEKSSRSVGSRCPHPEPPRPVDVHPFMASMSNHELLPGNPAKDGTQQQPNHKTGGKLLVLDGVNRVSALRLLNIPDVLVQMVDYEDEKVKLFSWNHLIFNAPKEEIIDKIRNLNLEVSFCPLNWGEEALKHERAISYFLFRDSIGFVVSDGMNHTNHTNGDITPEEKVKNLHQLIATYSSRSEIFYLDSDNHFLSIFEHFKNSSAVNLIPRFDKKEILNLVQKGILLPFGVTRFIVPNRFLGLEVSCLVLSAQTPLSEKNLFLKELLAYRIKTKKAKFYQESVTLFNE
ncbi:MAG: hypothetical protein MUO91_05700 [candidate division Zixibacteria bacterium]|nr:hypothetical protein [candidate division Zixibacteria bacterium]